MRVLIAHANEAVRTSLAGIVTRGRRLPLDVVGVGDGPGALDLLLADDPPAVALIDWDLPGIEAPEMCRLVRDFHHHHDTWIIVLASRAHQESTSEVWRAGADDCVHTPTPAKLLSDRVTKGLCEMAPPVREEAEARPKLDAFCTTDDEAYDDVFARPQASLHATVDADDLDRTVELAAGPAELPAQRTDLDDVDDARRAVTLDAVLAQL
jgi:DNA-binding response OmpR family regulator